jgi:hypothetical protein
MMMQGKVWWSGKKRYGSIGSFTMRLIARRWELSGGRERAESTITTTTTLPSCHSTRLGPYAGLTQGYPGDTVEVQPFQDMTFDNSCLEYGRHPSAAPEHRHWLSRNSFNTLIR